MSSKVIAPSLGTTTGTIVDTSCGKRTSRVGQPSKHITRGATEKVPSHGESLDISNRNNESVSAMSQSAFDSAYSESRVRVVNSIATSAEHIQHSSACTKLQQNQVPFLDTDS
ncbi:hypothetical protein ACJQWK_03141 [Exserohilum turcicum]|uniref:Uncharacterized protein n=1 Tax=Exserohilum turcicum (strain 28A) TaxID=671987 RepID=R0KRS1_EXST2|nr:uncharacterized protein SETTUDRAFT_30202 [Exserohilum turcica Et28A]EOA91684.1 hypothetical protein SETTUDRAFT_30202 [Exserohilum turcica Et28A]